MTPIATGPARSSATALSTPPLIATATRPGIGFGAEDLRQRVRQRVDGELVPADGSSLEQGQAVERPRQAIGFGADDPVPLDVQAHERPAPVTGGISDDLDHQPRLAILRPRLRREHKPVAVRVDEANAHRSCPSTDS